MPGFTAGTISNHGLIRNFATTDEKKVGVMVVTDKNNWLSRLANAPAPSPWGTTGVPVSPQDGNTGPMAKEWWSVWNYLNYNVGSVVVGSTGDSVFTAIASPPANTVLHSYGDKLNVLFSAGTTVSAEAVTNAAHARGDAFAVVGNLRGITQPVATGYTLHDQDFAFAGYTGSLKIGGTTGNNLVYVAGRKTFFLDYDGSGKTTTGVLDTASDVAACFAKTALNYNNWSIPAGFRKGAINGALTIDQSFSSTETQYLQDSGINVITQYPGKGTYFMGNSTAAAAAGATWTKGYMNIGSLVNYIKGEIKGLANEYLFEPNTLDLRSEFINRTSSVLDAVKSAGNISAYSVTCPPADNTGMTFTAQINITPVNVAEVITLKVVNNTTSEVFTL